MKETKFKNHFNASDFQNDNETSDKPSMTIPDQTLSIPEIMERFARGLPLGGANVELWEGEDDELDGVDLKTLDLSERYDLVKRRKEELEKLQEKYRKTIEEKQHQKRQEQAIKAYQQKLDEKANKEEKDVKPA